MKKRDVERGISILLWILMVLLAGYIIVKGLALEKKDMEYMMGNIQHQALKIYLPGITENWDFNEQVSFGVDKFYG